MHRSGGNLMGCVLACLLAVLVAVAPEGLADAHRAASSCGDGIEQPIAGGDGIQAGSAGSLDSGCCMGSRCGGVLPFAVTLPGGVCMAPGRSGGGDALYGLAPTPGRHPPRPLA